MLPDDLIVEVRDVDLVRRGQVESRLLNLKGGPVSRGVGSWTLALPAEHDLTQHLRQPGAGIIVTHAPTGRVLWSGPRGPLTAAADQADPQGMVTFTGSTDNVLLWRRIGLPDPTNPDVSTQAVAYDVRTGAAESVMRGLVDANIGPSAPAPRRVQVLTLQPDQQRGPQVTKSVRFDLLGDVLAEVAGLAGLGFQVVQVGDWLEFQVFTPRDQRSLVRLDLWNGTLAAQSVQENPATVTRAIVAGQGEGADRTLLEVTTPEAEAAEALWGPWGRAEAFRDARNTDDPQELAQVGLKTVQDGLGGTVVAAAPADDSTMQYPEAWDQGDLITVVVDGQELDAEVTQVSLAANANGVLIAAGIGDVVGWSPTAPLERRADDLERRISAVERNNPGGGPIDAGRVTSGVLDPARIPDLPAERITSGVFALPRIPDLPASRAQGYSALTTEDLNDVVESGLYHQSLSANATTARNYPAQGDVAGRLEVFAAGGFVYQRYTTFPGGSSGGVKMSRQFLRGRYQDYWGDWTEVGAGPRFRASGETTVTASGAVGGTRTVSFPAGRFPAAPKVLLTKQTDAAANFILYAHSITANGFVLGMYAGNGQAQTQTATVYWVAEYD